MKRKWIVVTCVILAAAGWKLSQRYLAPVKPTTPVSATMIAAQPAKSTDVAQQRPAEVLQRQNRPSQEQLKQRYEDFMAHRPLYLADIDLPGRYNVDENGNIVLNADFKDMLDFFLETIGDLSFAEIYDLIAGSMIAALEEPARSQALAFLDNYFAYIDAYDKWEHSFDKNAVMTADPVAMRDHLVDLENLRRQYLGEEAYGSFFSELDQTNDAYVEAQIALQQPNLTAGEKAAIKQNLLDSLPADVREAQQAAMVQVDLNEKIHALSTQGASAAEIYQARVEMVGEAAAQRLTQVDEENRRWDQKRSQYKALFVDTPGLDGMTVADKDAYIADVAQRELGLSVNEIKRMQALDRIEAAETTQ